MIANDSPYGVSFYTFDPINGTLPGQLITDMKSLGLTWLRYQLPWSFIEQTPGTYTWNALDAVVATCNSNNINLTYVIQESPLFYDQQPGYNTIGIKSGGNQGSTALTLSSPPSDLYAPALLRVSGGTGAPEIIAIGANYTSGNTTIPLATPIQGNNRTLLQFYLSPDPTATRNFALAVATRYNGQNGYGSLQAIEIGNEEYDSQNSNGNAPNAYNDRAATYYLNVLPVVAPAIRAANPNALVGMCAIWWNQLPHVSNFMNTVYQASPSMKNNFDYVNFHYYVFDQGAKGQIDLARWSYDGLGNNSKDPSFPMEWQALQTVMSNHGDAGKDIRVTEWGWYTTTVTGRNAQNVVSQDVQSRNYFALLESARLSGIISHVFLYTLDYAPRNAALNRDNTTGPGVPPGGYPISDGFSLVQVRYVSGQPQTSYTLAYTTLKNYIARYPSWISQFGKTPALLGQDMFITAPNVPAPGPRPNNVFGFGPTSDNQSWSHKAGNGRTALENSEGQLSSSVSAYDYFVYGSNTALNQELSLRLATTSASDVYGLIARVNGSNSNNISAYAFTLGSTLTISKIINGTAYPLLIQSFSQSNGTFYRLRFRVVGNNPVTLYGRIWPEGTVEPASWTIIATDNGTHNGSALNAGGFGMYGWASSSQPIQFDSFSAIDATLIQNYTQQGSATDPSGKTLNMIVTSDQPWLTVTPASGSTQEGSNGFTLNIAIDPQVLTSGNYQADAAITYTNPSGTQDINISITVM